MLNCGVISTLAYVATKRGMQANIPAPSPPPAHTNNPGPAGATSLIIPTLPPVTTDYNNQPYAGPFWYRIEYNTTDDFDTQRYWFYVEYGTSLSTIVIPNLAANSYYWRVVAGYPSDQEGNPSQSSDAQASV